MHKYIWLHIGDYLLLEDIINVILACHELGFMKEYYYKRVCVERGIKLKNRTYREAYIDQLNKSMMWLSLEKFKQAPIKINLGNIRKDMFGININIINNKYIIYRKDGFYHYLGYLHNDTLRYHHINERIESTENTLLHDYDKKYCIFMMGSCDNLYIYDIKNRKLVRTITRKNPYITVNNNEIGYFDNENHNTYIIDNFKDCIMYDLSEYNIDKWYQRTIKHDKNWIYINTRSSYKFNYNFCVISRSDNKNKLSLNNVFSYFLQDHPSRCWVYMSLVDEKVINIYSTDNNLIKIIQSIKLSPYSINLCLKDRLSDIDLKICGDVAILRMYGRYINNYNNDPVLHTNYYLLNINSKFNIPIQSFPSSESSNDTFTSFDIYPFYAIFNNNNKILILDLRKLNYRSEFNTYIAPPQTISPNFKPYITKDYLIYIKYSNK